MLVHPKSNYHYIFVFPNDIDLVKIKESYAYSLGDCRWATIVRLDDFNRESLGSHDNFVLFFKRLPPWLPMETEAKIGIYYLGRFDERGRHIPIVEPDLHQMELENWMNRVDIVFAYPDIKNHIRSGHLSIPIYDGPIGGNMYLFGMTNKGQRLLSERRYWILTYGPLCGFREVVHRFLSEKLGKKYLHYNGPVDYLHEVIKDSQSVLYVTEPEETIHPVHVFEGVSAGAVVIVSSQSCFPLQTRSGEVYHLFANPESLNNSLLYFKKYREKWIYGTDSPAYSRMTRYTPSEIMDDFIIQPTQEVYK